VGFKKRRCNFNGLNWVLEGVNGGLYGFLVTFKLHQSIYYKKKNAFVLKLQKWFGCMLHFKFQIPDFAQTLARHHTLNIHIKFRVGNSSSVNIWPDNGCSEAKFPISAEIFRNLNLYASNFLVPHSWTRMNIWLWVV
jgi:hypothetical protein